MIKSKLAAMMMRMRMRRSVCVCVCVCVCVLPVVFSVQVLDVAVVSDCL